MNYFSKPASLKRVYTMSGLVLLSFTIGLAKQTNVNASVMGTASIAEQKAVSTDQNRSNSNYA